MSVVANSDIPLSTRKSLALALILSKGSYGIGTWPALGPSEYSRFTHAVLTTYRALLGKQRWKQLKGSDPEVIAELQLPSPARLITIARLRLFSRLITKSFWPALAMIVAGKNVRKSWYSGLAEYFKWLASVDEQCIF